jgi:NADH-quinone oxidoreductase subunit G
MRISQKMKAAKPERIGIILGDLVAAEEAFSIRQLAEQLGVKNIDCRQDGSPLGEAGGRAGYLFNSGIAGIDEADNILLIGTNPRTEAPVLNARIRKRHLRGGVNIAVIGERADLTYPYAYLGAGPESLAALNAEPLDENVKRPMIVVGQGALARADGAAVLANVMKLAQKQNVVREGWNGLNILHTVAGRAGALDVRALPAEDGMNTRQMLDAAKAGELDVLFLLGADEIDTQNLGTTFVAYQGTHGDAGAHRADAVLPAAAYTEKQVTYVNTEGRPQMTSRASFPPGEAKEDWAILRALSDALGSTLPWNNLDELRSAMYKVAPHLARLNIVEKADATALADLAMVSGKMSSEPFRNAIGDFYMTNPIARASKIMADCSALKSGRTLAAAE